MECVHASALSINTRGITRIPTRYSSTYHRPAICYQEVIAQTRAEHSRLRQITHPVNTLSVLAMSVSAAFPHPSVFDLRMLVARLVLIIHSCLLESIPPEDTTVQRSSCEESLPDTWEIPGGTAELHEPNLGASAARELYGETGLRVNVIMTWLGTYIYVETDPVTGEIKLRSDGKALKWRKYSFLAEVEGGKDSGPPNVLLDPEEHQAYADTKAGSGEELREAPNLIYHARQIDTPSIIRRHNAHSVSTTSNVNLGTKMPPSVPRKRLREDSPSSRTPKRRQATGIQEATPPSNSRKASLYDDLDATAGTSAQGGKSFLEALDEESEDSSLTDLSDAEFEDVPITGRQRASGPADDDEGDEDDDPEFEDVAPPAVLTSQPPAITGDLELTLHRDTRISLTNPFGNKKGPSKIERKIRNATHCVHVQFLLWHNAIRNAWVCDPEVQAIMMSHVPPRLFDEADRWRQASGLEPKKNTPKDPKGKRAARQRTYKSHGTEGARDWGSAADKLEEGAVDMSHGDPLFRLVKALAAWWKQRFRITAPGLRKCGYMSLERLDRLTKAWANGNDDIYVHGERIRHLDEFRQCAISCSGSRDVGSQLFTALLRALGMEARMVASLQPLGFGWTKAEEADAEKDTSTLGAVQRSKMGDTEVSESMESAYMSRASTAPGTPINRSGAGAGRKTRAAQASRSEELALEYPDSDEDAIIDAEVSARKDASESKTFDRGLEFPHYWTEVLSPVTNTYLPVDPIVKKVVATNRELVESLEPRGGKADKAKQVMAYVVGFSPDGTAKDVTVRYLKRKMLPGRTKGMRMPVEKVPVYNRHGKVKRHEEYDWFKTVMNNYVRGGRKHPVTEVDETEDTTDLKPTRPEKKEVKDGEETLQYYKQSKEFCLERHLKREEALVPTAKPVKIFRNKGKGKEGASTEEPVYLRKDVVTVKSAETWHKQGRAPLAGQEPLKRVPYRAATTNRRREIAEAEAISGEKVLQGLYSFDQTDWIIPAPIQNGIIPKNEYGNIDLFVEHMCPEGAVHVPFRGVVKVCKRLQIDYAEAVVDFEFGHRMAVPVIQGAVIAEEYYDRVMEELRKDEAERARKEDEKKRKEVLRLWSKFIKGLRIVERIRQEYGHIDDNVVDVHVFGRRRIDHTAAGVEKAEQSKRGQDEDEDMAGGFLPDGHDDKEHVSPEETGSRPVRHTSGFFPDLDDEEDGADDLLVDYGDHDKHGHLDAGAEVGNEEEGSSGLPAPVVAEPRPQRKVPAAAASRGSRRRRRRLPLTEDEDGEEDVDEEVEWGEV
ncbi:Rad4-domain-containing protein [Sodiomyces alkalinus F11]|uniref:Rad4-domain-containing protein n=1 Tax=Sodiomyces alkalinus (strain CBS 110278 / VKM F-3762 / F11) TaxID=1314773 RepID=A0A3N2Q8F7_SODAK|nr:Rad4-domain-containing protein [Sodiomyces alkalinus F11]ROT42905.1 Rad4-domain-containing protein [Sodiomyces alkalinus F11]